MATVINSRIQFRRDTAANWALYPDVVPYAGEPCFETNTGVFKIGDGATTYANLKPIGGAELAPDGKSIILDAGKLKLAGFDAATVGAYLVKGEGDTLNWVVPEVTNESLSESVTEITNALGAPADGETAATGIYAELGSKADASVIGAVPENKTIVQMIADAQEAATYDDTQVKAAIEALEGKAHEHANQEELDKIVKGDKAKWDAMEENAVNRVLGYLASEEVNESYDTLKEVAAWIESDTTASATLVTRVSDLEKVGAEKNVIASVDTAQFAIDENRNLTLLDIAMGKITGLSDALGAKVDKEDGSRLITADEIAKLAKLVIDEETGDVGLSGSISADNVVGLQDKLDKKVNVEEGKSLVSDTLIAKLEAIEVNAQENKIETVKVGETVLDIVGKTVVVPVGAGLKASEEITVAEDGTLGIGTISFDKIVQGSNEIIFNGGTAGSL